MRVQPFTTHPGLTHDELGQYECSDRIVLPLVFSTEMYINVNDLLMLTNLRDQYVCGTVFGTHTHDSAVAYIPTWMTHVLDILDPITISHTLKRRCTMLQIKPHAESFQKHPRFIELLKTALFLHHKSVSKKSRIPLLVEKEITYLTIEHIEPSNITTCFLYNGGIIDIQILDSLERESIEKPPTFLYRSGRGTLTQHPSAFVGRGHSVGGCFTTPYFKTPQEAAAAAAKKRAILLAQGKRV